MPTAPTSRGLIMVVDDVEDNRILLARALGRAGFETVSCENGVDAIAQISTEPPDLVMLDWMMPGLSGLDVLCAIRSHHDANSLPVIMCTARDEASSISQAIDAGANDYVQKPLNLPITIARINAQLERSAALRAVNDMNRDLEAALAQRTRALMTRRDGPFAGQPPRADEIAEILRVAAWLRTSDGADAGLLNACAATLTSVAHRLSAS
jgi:DNA-binding response OmpR family regulator